MDELLRKTVAEILPEIVELRHELHQHPEIRFEEVWTAGRVARFLDQAAIPYQQGLAKGTGIVATIQGGAGNHANGVVALRADMDALEIHEETGLPYASQVPNRMHACGHDGHTACLCGVAKVLARHKDRLPGVVKLLFQPAEEVAGGARFMIEDGALDGVDAIFAFHGWPSIPLGQVAIKSGCLMAGAQDFRIVVRGAGCHAADPAAGIDPIVPAAHIVTALQSIVSREIDPRETGVVTIAMIQAGHATNIIPETAELRGTLRSLEPKLQEKLAATLERIAVETARAYRATAEVELGQHPYPPLHNDPAMSGLVRETVIEALGNDKLIELDVPCMASEDFAFYLQRVPGAFFYLGLNPDPAHPYPPLHSARYDFPDAAIPTAVRLLSRLTLRFLHRP